MSRKSKIDERIAGLLVGVMTGFALTGAAAAAEGFNPETHAGPLPAELRSESEAVANPSSAIPGKKVTLTLSDAIDQAMTHNPNVREFQEKVHEADAIHGLALAPLFPQISMTASLDTQEDPLDIGNPNFGGLPYNNYQFNLKFDQSIYAGGGTFAALNDAKLEKQLRTYDLEGGQRDTAVLVLQAYYSVALAKRTLESLERNMKVQDDLLKLTKHRELIGRNQLLDTLNIETQKALLVPQIEAAKNAMRTNAAALALLIGEGKTTEFHLPDGLEPIDASFLLDKEKAPRGPIPQLEHAQLARVQFEDKTTEAIAPYMPSLDIVANWGRQAYVKTELLNEDSTAYNVGLQLNIPIFQGLAMLSAKRQMASQSSQLEIAQEATILTTATAEVTAREALLLAQANLKAYRDAYVLGAKSLKEAIRTYRLATIDYTQFLSTEQSFFSAEVSYEQAKYNTINSAAQYCAAAGIPLKYLIELLGVKKS